MLLLLSFFFLFRSFSDNTFLSPLVRIQEERKQQLVTTGVYRFVRHPMYLGAILIGTPFLLGSYYGLALGLIMIVLIAMRTIGEEKMLMKEFRDYEEYKKKVRYRFLPFVW
jgi:protein-S-isoprenylcysteine O-methyltransferase Ste14